MRKVGQDRAAWVSSPPEPNTARELERLRDQDTNIETVGGGGDVTFEVTGAIPEFTGVPAGLQQFYSAPLVVDNTIDMNNTFYLEDDLSGSTSMAGGVYLTQDIQNATGWGSNTIVGKRRDVSAIVGYNLVDGSVNSMPFTVNGTVYGFRRVGNSLVTDMFANSSTATIAVVTDGIVSSVTLIGPTFLSGASAQLVGLGVHTNGSDIIAVWRASGSIIPRTYKKVSYSINGTKLLESNEFTGPYINSSGSMSTASGGGVVVHNGHVALFGRSSDIGGTGLLYYTPADTSNTVTLVYIDTESSSIVRKQLSSNITTDGYMFGRSNTDDVWRFNLPASSVAIWPNALQRFDESDPPVQVGKIIVDNMFTINDTKFVIAGAYSDFVPSPSYQTYPCYSSAEVGGGGLQFSDSVFSSYVISVSGSPIGSIAYGNGAWGVVRTLNNTVYYALKTPGGGTEPDIIIGVTGP